jgi:hypothetical protein
MMFNPLVILKLNQCLKNGNIRSDSKVVIEFNPGYIIKKLGFLPDELK